MKNMLISRVKYAMTGEKGSLSLEQIVMISVILVLATAFFFFKDKLVDFLDRAGGSVESLKVSGGKLE